jgi:hypothetical protein
MDRRGSLRGHTTQPPDCQGGYLSQ